MTRDIKWVLWEPSDWERHNGFKVSEEHCRHYVYESGDWRSHQCLRKRKVMIQSYGFCTQHAKKLIDRRGYEEDT